jgi:hypothetical protein
MRETAMSDKDYVPRHAEDDASARHCEIRIDGMPGQLPPGEYRISFGGYAEYPAGGRMVLRFRWLGAAEPSAREQLAEAFRTAASQPVVPFDSGGVLPPAPEDERSLDDLRRQLHEGDITPSEAQRIVMDRKLTEADASQILAAARDEIYGDRLLLPPAPDLYQVSQVEVINVSRLARVIAELLRKDAISGQAIGISVDYEGDVAASVERWLRS